MLSSSAQTPSSPPARRRSLDEILDDPKLPSPPALVLQIVEKASHPDCNPNEVVALLNKDSGLCSQVLKTVNSGMYGLTKPVGTLKQAVTLLGLRPLRSMVLSLALPAIQGKERDEIIVRYWQESVAGAVIARELAMFLRRKDPDDDLIAGLLRDLGILVLRQAYPDEYLPLRRKYATIWTTRQPDLEAEAFGADHAEISAALLESWNLPEELYQPIRWHHDPAQCPGSVKLIGDRAYLLFFASKVALLGIDPSITVSDLVKWAKQHFGMDQSALIKFLGSVTPAIRDFASLLKVDIGECPNYAAIITTGCQELVRLSVETSRDSAANSKRDSNKEMAAVEKTVVFTSPPAAQTSLSSRNGTGASTLPDFQLDWLDALPVGGGTLNGYIIESIIGRGAMGVVLKAHDPVLDRRVAIKMLRPEGMVQSDGRDRFTLEARAVAAIQHENVVTIYAVSEINGLPYLVMEFVPGTSLQELLDKNGRLPFADVIRYGRQVAAGLSAAHRRRIIHRDIKPANILIASESSSAKISDFGLARLLDQTRVSVAGTWVGTPQYMAPEQFAAADVDPRADLFSLGSLLYTLCTGRPPFVGNSILALMNEINHKHPIPLRSARPDSPGWLIDLINKLHAKSPAHRYQSAADVVAAFEQGGSGSGMRAMR